MMLLGKLAGGWQLTAAACALSLVVGAAGTWRVMSWKEAAQRTHAVEHALGVVKKQDAITTKAETKAVETHDRIVFITQKVIKEVPKYVTAKDDAACTIPLNFVSLWNATANGSVPKPATVADGAPSGVRLSTVAGAAVEDHGTYNDVASRLTQLQDWVTAQEAVKR